VLTLVELVKIMEELNTVELDYYMTSYVIAVEEIGWNHNYF
jgi:hypothetical protein